MRPGQLLARPGTPGRVLIWACMQCPVYASRHLQSIADRIWGITKQALRSMPSAPIWLWGLSMA